MAVSPQNIKKVAPSLSLIPMGLVLPAYVALTIATGIAAYVLGYHMDVTAFSFAYSAAFLLAIASAFVSNHGAEGYRFGAMLVRFVTVPVLLVVAILSNSELFFTRTWLSDANDVVAGYLGLVMVGCILMIGVRIEGKPIPVSMPLVATLSLFGLLNLVLVDTIVQVGFLIFTAAGLFLIGYERLLTNWQRRRNTGLYADRVHDESHSEEHMRRTTRQFVGASAVWFAIFVAGALLAYIPLYAALPGIMPTNALNKLSQANQTQFGWSRSPRQLEVRGGTHTLTERPVMKISKVQGESPDLWRGRVYRNYVASSWTDEDNPEDLVEVQVKSEPINPFLQQGKIQREITWLKRDSAAPNPRFGVAHLVTATIEPIVTNSTVFYSAGIPVSMQALWRQSYLNRHTGAVGTASFATSPLNYADPRYTITGRTVEKLPSSNQAPGLTQTELQEWQRNPERAPFLKVTDDAGNDARLKAIAMEILEAERRRGTPADTPVRKALAVSAYLHEHCLYSLDAPLTPSSEDGVLYFLNQSKVGACDMFASAMTLLLRSMDVPARLVTGYLEPDVGEARDAGLTTGTITIRERDAHAWVEYYVPEMGWIAHDPSAGTRLADDSWFSRLKKMLTNGQLLGSGAFILIPIAGLLLLTAGLFWPQIEKQLGRAPLADNTPEQQRQRIECVYEQATRLVQRHARKSRTPFPSTALTAQEFDDWLSRTPLPAEARQEFAGLTYLRNAARYGALAPDIEDKHLQASLDRLKEALR
ncbi:MAG TPA: transglutaminase domain-containing protein [Abditibacteriaceae bacterium]|jgi:transglutaminase-like putative cysteine protease